MGKLINAKDSLMEDNLSQTHIPMSPDAIQTSPLDLSLKNRPFVYPQRSPTPSNSCTNTIFKFGRQMSIENKFEPPKILTQPKKEWHYRSLKDLLKKHLPYLAGIGPQRTPIRVSVCREINTQMYLRIAIKTIDNEDHPSKVIVPAKTHVNTEHLLHDNNLDCLQFNECNPTDYFDKDEKCIYLEITPTEHQRGYKEVRIHMFNLYQNHALTKDMIISQQLNLCRLAFSLCIHGNGQFIHVSEPSYSSLIEEKKMTTRSRVSPQLNCPISMSDPRAQFFIDSDNVDNTDDDNSF